MALSTVSAVIDGNHIRWLEPAPVQGAYRVLITFVEPENAAHADPSDTARFWNSFGAWQDAEPVEATLATIHDARQSRVEPPPL